MRRRELLGTGMVTAQFAFTGRAQQTDYEHVTAARYGVSGLTTGLSRSGDVVLFGFDDGNIAVYDDDRDGDVIRTSVNRGVSHIEVSEEAETAVIGWIDSDIFAPLDLATGVGPLIEHSGL